MLPRVRIFLSPSTNSPTQLTVCDLKDAGASLVRDSIDAFLIDELKSYGADGALISDETASPVNGPGEIDPGTALVDSDEDGIPDDAEEELGTDPQTADSMELHSSGYTNLEVWANSLVPES